MRDATDEAVDRQAVHRHAARELRCVLVEGAVVEDVVAALEQVEHVDALHLGLEEDLDGL